MEVLQYNTCPGIVVKPEPMIKQIKGTWVYISAS